MSGTPTRSDTGAGARGGDLRAVRAGVVRRPGLVGAPLRKALSAAYDDWLAARLGELGQPAGVALVAVGGYGRCEPSPFSDLDLVLLHSGRVDGLDAVADGLWYPIWDAGIDLDHSVRTPEQALAVARDDLKALLGLLDVRHVAGDCAVSAALRSRVLDLWRAGAARRVPELRALAREAEAKAQEKTEAAKEAVLAETRAKLAELGVDLDGLLKTPPPKKAGRGVPPPALPVKFRGPHGETWSGRGKVPGWLAEAERQGRKRSEFLV